MPTASINIFLIIFLLAKKEQISKLKVTSSKQEKHQWVKVMDHYLERLANIKEVKTTSLWREQVK
jgi:hypothetical protein